MKFQISYIATLTLIATSVLLSSCFDSEDPGPLQEVEQEFGVTDFDRLEMGDAFNIDVKQGNFFEITVRGDRRNVEDLLVKKQGSTLVIRFDENDNRRHTTYIEITMPALLSANFSGASDSRISGFGDVPSFALHLSGASVSQLDMNAEDLEVDLSGASRLSVWGEGSNLHADLSGASVLKAFNFPVEDAVVKASGASDVQVSVSTSLQARAAGASVIRYRGNPSVTSEVSGASVVEKD